MWKLDSCPAGPGLSRLIDHMESIPSPLARANTSRRSASCRVKTSLVTSLTPSIGVTPNWFQPNVCPWAANSVVICAKVALAASMAYSPIDFSSGGAALSP